MNIGDKIDNFTLPSVDGDVSLHDFLGKKVVLYFYPKDMTKGCTIEAEDFRDHMEDFESLNTVVLGVSSDNLKQHQKFVEKNHLNYILLSDEQIEVHERFGVWTQKNTFGQEHMGTERSTFIIDEAGALEKAFRKVKVAGHVEEVLDYLKK